MRPRGSFPPGPATAPGGAVMEGGGGGGFLWSVRGQPSISHPQTITSFPSRMGLRLSLSSQAVLPGSSGHMEAAAARAGVPFSALTPSPALPSGCGGPTPALLPLPGCAFAWLHHGLCDTATEPLSLGSAMLNPEGQCKAGSAFGLRFSFQFHQRWISPGQYHAGLT